MPNNTLNLIPGAVHDTDAMYSVRDEPPMSYTSKINGFSLLPKMLVEDNLENYESKEFSAGGYNWNLSLFPQGDYKNDGADHISLYLNLSKNNPSLKPGWELDVVFTFFVYNHNDNNYVTVRDGKVWRLHQVRRQCGFAKLLMLPEFENVSNGYLDNEDRCVFGVEVFALKSEGKGERVAITDGPDGGSFSFTVKKFFMSNVAERLSDVHTIAGRKWRLDVYPNGHKEAKAEGVSVYLSWADSEADRKGKKVFVKFYLTIKDQSNNGNDVVRHHNLSIYNESSTAFGFSRFMPITDIKGKKGFLVKDTCIVNAKITLISEVYDM